METLLKELESKNLEQHHYSSLEIENVANKILTLFDYYTKDSSTPVVKIVKEFGFKALKANMEDSDLAGDISINGDTKEKYNCDKVILVNEDDDLFYQRFVTAHELAHYLFDFVGNVEYKDTNKQYTAAYYRNHHDSLEERRANRFAAALLMPKQEFIKQYNIAKCVDSNGLFICTYLSRFFEVPTSSVERRILEVL